MELDSANVVHVAQKCEKTAPQLVVPNFDLVVITTGHKEGLSRMKADSSDRPCSVRVRVRMGEGRGGEARKKNSATCEWAVGQHPRRKSALTVVFVKAVEERSDAVIPQLDEPIVK